MKQAFLQIGDVANRAGVNVQTLRYYERVGVLKPNIRRDSGYRIYDEDAIRKVLFIKKSQELGFSLDEIKELLLLKASKVSKCEEVQEKARQQLSLVEEKLNKLSLMKSLLTSFINRCENRELTVSCPLLASIEEIPMKGKEE